MPTPRAEGLPARDHPGPLHRLVLYDLTFVLCTRSVLLLNGLEIPSDTAPFSAGTRSP